MQTPGSSTTRLLVGVISAMVEKELGEKNFSFDSLKSRLSTMAKITPTRVSLWKKATRDVSEPDTV